MIGGPAAELGPGPWGLAEWGRISNLRSGFPYHASETRGLKPLSHHSMSMNMLIKQLTRLNLTIGDKIFTFWDFSRPPLRAAPASRTAKISKSYCVRPHLTHVAERHRRELAPQVELLDRLRGSISERGSAGDQYAFPPSTLWAFIRAFLTLSLDGFDSDQPAAVAALATDWMLDEPGRTCLVLFHSSPPFQAFGKVVLESTFKLCFVPVWRRGPFRLARIEDIQAYVSRSHPGPARRGLAAAGCRTGDKTGCRWVRVDAS